MPVASGPSLASEWLRPETNRAEPNAFPLAVTEQGFRNAVARSSRSSGRYKGTQTTPRVSHGAAGRAQAP